MIDIGQFLVGFDRYQVAVRFVGKGKHLMTDDPTVQTGTNSTSIRIVTLVARGRGVRIAKPKPKDVMLKFSRIEPLEGGFLANTTNEVCANTACGIELTCLLDSCSSPITK